MHSTAITTAYTLILLISFALGADKPDQTSQRVVFPRPKSKDLLQGPYFQGDIAASYSRIKQRFGKQIATIAQARGYTRTLRGGGERSRLLSASSEISRRWKREDDVVVLPYVFEEGGFASEEQEAVLAGMKDIETRTKGLFKFVLHEEQKDYLKVVRGASEDDCFSYVGRLGAGGQPLSLTAKCLSLGAVQHELLHALGFWHEHSRSDRDEHVEVLKHNVLLGKDSEFVKEETQSEESIYDYSSVMHFAANTFAQAKHRCLTQDFNRRRGMIRFTVDGARSEDPPRDYCLLPQRAPVEGVQLDFFPCNVRPDGNPDRLWEIRAGLNGFQGNLIRFTDTSLCISMRDVGGGKYLGLFPLMLRTCPSSESSIEEAKSMHFFFSASLIRTRLGQLKLLQTEIRPVGDPFLCLDHANEYLETTICSAVDGSVSEFQRWDFASHVLTKVQGIQLGCNYTKVDGEFELQTTLKAPKPIGQRSRASDEDIRELVAFYEKPQPEKPLPEFIPQRGSILANPTVIVASSASVLAAVILALCCCACLRRRRNKLGTPSQLGHIDERQVHPAPPRKQTANNEFTSTPHVDDV